MIMIISMVKYIYIVVHYIYLINDGFGAAFFGVFDAGGFFSCDIFAADAYVSRDVFAASYADVYVSRDVFCGLSFFCVFYGDGSFSVPFRPTESSEWSRKGSVT